MHWNAFTTFDDSRATPVMIFRDAWDVGQAVNQAMCAISQVPPVSLMAHKIHSGIAGPEGILR